MPLEGLKYIGELRGTYHHRDGTTTQVIPKEKPETRELTEENFCPGCAENQICCPWHGPIKRCYVCNEKLIGLRWLNSIIDRYQKIRCHGCVPR